VGVSGVSDQSNNSSRSSSVLASYWLRSTTPRPFALLYGSKRQQRKKHGRVTTKTTTVRERTANTHGDAPLQIELMPLGAVVGVYVLLVLELHSAHGAGKLGSGRRGGRDGATSASGGTNPAATGPRPAGSSRRSKPSGVGRCRCSNGVIFRNNGSRVHIRSSRTSCTGNGGFGAWSGFRLPENSGFEDWTGKRPPVCAPQLAT
jgi:hypothetical protein